ncbi:MAG: TetR/AcrR family transcriptional regulator [Clostridiales bacterium]|nr:TetR/AcrR family transcriptional regulator [Clostridiales bacterium]
MRIIKDAKVRKDEILDTAQRLFHEKGYAQTSMEDISWAIGIARGTVYYYFKNKEDILSAMIDRQIDQREMRLRQIADNPALSATEKLFQIIQFQVHSGILADGLHDTENARLHQKSFQRSLFRFTPILAKIIEQGNTSGEFSCPWPAESVQLLYCASQLHDPGVFTWEEGVRKQKMNAFYWMLEVTLGISTEAKKQLYQLAHLS